MTFSARPLISTRDLALFVDRAPQRQAAARGLRSGLNCAVTGDVGSGRTSFLHRVLADLRATGQEPARQVVARVGGATDAAAIVSAVSAELALIGFASPSVVPTGGIAGRTDALAALGSLGGQLEAAATTAAAGPVVIALDDVPAEAGMELFGALRDDLWQLPASWIATVPGARAAELLRPPADVFFEVRIDLVTLSDADAVALLRAREPDLDPGLADHVVRAAGGNPRRLVDLARQVLAAPDAAEVMSGAVARRDAAIARLSRPAQVLAGELDALGAAAASDPALLDRMGWTRARAVQVFGELEDNGLVVHALESTGRGRPRKVFRLVDPSDFSRAEAG